MKFELSSLGLLMLLASLGAGCNGGGSEADGDADTDSGPEPCEEEGATRTVPCELCGTASQRCEGGLWVTGDCLYQGECEEGQTETETTPSCGERTRLCDASCHWMEWQYLVPDGECEAGTTREVTDECPPGWSRTDTCSEACEWILGECNGPSPCGRAPRTDPPLREEICIPAGPFIRGDDELPSSRPAGEVYLSGYYIDRYPVTNAEYIECLDAGICRPLATGYSRYARDPEYANRPVSGVTSAEAAEIFCQWDGGRRLPTEAEWEKAARGPAPRDNRYVWGDDENSCSYIIHDGCEGYDRSLDPPPFPDDVDSLPVTASYYGVELLVGGGYEFVSDYFSRDYFSDPDSYYNPTGPEYSPSTGHVIRGVPRSHEYMVFTDRVEYNFFWQDEVTFRCARDADIRD